MSDTPRTDVAEHNMGSVVEPHYVVDADFSRYLERELVGARAEIVWLKGEAQYGATFVQRAIDAERELAEARDQLRLCNIDQFTTAAELAEAVAKERERCALVCEEFYSVENIAQKCAEAIRKGE